VKRFLYQRRIFQIRRQLEPTLIKLRIDVDYPYPSRIRSFIYTALGIKVGSDYLRNSKIIAKMLNKSPKEVKAYWFFTPKTIPDKELLALIDNSRHEVALHIANDPYKELELLERSTRKKTSYYTIHGTARLLGRIMWKRWKEKKPKIPEDFPLQSFYQFKTTSLDIMCHIHTTGQSLKVARDCINEGQVLHFHPIWLFQRGRLNPRGPFYETLKRILEVDNELQTLSIRKKLFFIIGCDASEYEIDVVPSEKFLEKLAERGMDIFTFIERRWSHSTPNPPRNWLKAADNIALLQITTYEEWLRNIGKKTRNMIRKAEKNEIKTTVAEPNEELAEGIWKIYNETPIRQGRGFPHYGTKLRDVVQSVLSSQNCTYIGAYLQNELAGFILLVHGDHITLISQILSLQKYWDKAVNNALIAKAIEVCANRHEEWIMYGRMGNHPTLDIFKQNNGFTRFQLARYYIPLTKKGKIATRLGLHREMKDALPQSIKYQLIPVYNWISRTKTRIKPQRQKLAP
jgi:hypothetical protein